MFDALKEPVYDLRFLLDRSYNKDPAIRIVADKYRLTKKQRNFLLRAIFSKEEAKEHKQKINKKINIRTLLISTHDLVGGKIRPQWKSISKYTPYSRYV